MSLFENSLFRKIRSTTGRRLPRVLLIEEDEDLAALLRQEIERAEVGEVCVASDIADATALLGRHGFDLILADGRSPASLESLRSVPAAFSLEAAPPPDWFNPKKTPVILITDCDTSETDRSFRSGGRFRLLGVITKAQSVDEIVEQVRWIYGNAALPATG